MVDQIVRYDYAWKTPGWTVQNPTFLIEQPDTFSDPGLPAAVSKVTVNGKFRDDRGRFLDGLIQIRTSKILEYVPENVQVLPGVLRVRFTDRGFSIALPATNDVDLAPVGWEYEMRLTVAGVTQEFSTPLPASPATVDIIDLIAAAQS